MKVELHTPTKAYLIDPTKEDLYNLRKELTYTNTSHQHNVKRWYHNKWVRQKDPVKWEQELERLKSLVKNTLVWEDERGVYIRPGSIPHVKSVDIEITRNLIKYPKPKKIAWAKPLPFELHPYQTGSVENLLSVIHGNVELCTGAGKSAIAMVLARETGFRCAIIAPSKNIFLGLVAAFEHHLGRGNVGKFGNGTKKIGKRITICIADSLVNVKPGTKEWDFFNGLDMIIADESHTWGAETLDEVGHGVFSNVPYRFFLSGTQTRGDGTEKLLDSIIGKNVYVLTTEEAIEKGYVCHHSYSIITIESSNPYFSSPNPLESKRQHLLYNYNARDFAAKIANAKAKLKGQQTLILVEELEQIKMILPKLEVPYAIAHSEKNAKKLAELGISKVNPEDSVEAFNKNEVKVLIGTSCISTGTNIYPNHNTVNWQGGSSWIKTAQGAVGRSVRKGEQNPYKNKCLEKTHCDIYDFNVLEETMRRHLEDRIKVYEQSGTEIKFLKVK